MHMLVVILLCALWIVSQSRENFSRGCGPGKVWDGTRCRYSMRTSGIDACPPGLVWDPEVGNCNYPKFLYNRGRRCPDGKVWDGTRCRYPGMQASGVQCPEGTVWDQNAGHCEFANNATTFFLS